MLSPKLSKRKFIYYLIISKHYITFNLYLIVFIILSLQDKFQIYQKYHVYHIYHVYLPEFMKDKTNDHLINHLKKGKNKNILFQFLVSKFEDGTDQSYNLNIKEYLSYKKLYERRR